MLRKSKKEKVKKEKAPKVKKEKAPKKPRAKKEKVTKVKKTTRTKPTADGIALPKPATNVYMVMLMLSFLFVLTSCIVLFLHLKTYGDFPQWKA